MGWERRKGKGRERNRKWNGAIKPQSPPLPSDIFPPVRPYPSKVPKLPKQQHHMGMEGSNEPGGHFSFKAPRWFGKKFENKHGKKAEEGSVLKRKDIVPRRNWLGHQRMVEKPELFLGVQVCQYGVINET